MGIVFKNNAKTTLSSAVNNSTTTIPVTEGSVFPAVNLSGAGTFFLLTLDDETNNEILKVTSCSGASGNIDLTVIRAQEGTTARAFSSGDKAELRFTSGTVDEIRSDNTVHTNIFTTSNNSTTAFTLSDEVANENDLVVFIDGVFQAHNTFSVSGTTLTLATAPASGRVVTVYSIKGSRSASNVALATMTGDNSDTTLTLPVEPINENSVQVFFDGVYQNKDSFSISGTTLTFGVAPPTGVAVEALVFTKLAINTSSILSDTDADTKVQVEESSDEDKIRFDTGGTERMVLDSNVLQVNTSSVANLSIGNSSDVMEVKAKKDGTDDVDLAFHTQASGGTTGEVMRISSDGKVGIGTTNPAAELHVNKTNAGGLGGRMLIQNASSNSGTFCQLIMAPTAATAADRCVIIQAENTDGNNNQAMVFKTSAGASPAERMRIYSGGQVTIGLTSIVNSSMLSVGDGGVGITYSGAPANYYRQIYQSSSGNLFFYNGSNQGYINQAGAFNDASDERIKKDIEDISYGLDTVKALKPRKYKMKLNDDEQIGFIAQEVESLVPEVVNTGETPDGEEQKGMSYGHLTAVLTKAIQEQQTIIDDLKSRIETLEG